MQSSPTQTNTNIRTPDFSRERLGEWAKSPGKQFVADCLLDIGLFKSPRFASPSTPSYLVRKKFIEVLFEC